MPSVVHHCSARLYKSIKMDVVTFVWPSYTLKILDKYIGYIRIQCNENTPFSLLKYDHTSIYLCKPSVFNLILNIVKVCSFTKFSYKVLFELS